MLFTFANIKPSAYVSAIKLINKIQSIDRYTNNDFQMANLDAIEAYGYFIDLAVKLSCEIKIFNKTFNPNHLKTCFIVQSGIIDP